MSLEHSKIRQQFTPWQKLKFFGKTLALMEDKSRRCKSGESPVDPCCYPCLTYYHNGKENICCKSRYDYNFLFCEGYDQNLHRDDRKHPHFYMNIDTEEEYPCRTIPLCTNSNCGHRPPIDSMISRPKIKQIPTFYRNNGAPCCMNANGYSTVRLNPTWALRYNAEFGYTYSPPRQ